MPLKQAKKQIEKELDRVRNVPAPRSSRSRGSVARRSQGRPNDPNQQTRRVQRDLDRAAQRTANQAQREANSPTLRDPVPYATSQPVNPVGANGLREQRAREATQPASRTEGLTQEQQAAMIGAGNQPADGVGNGQPTMAERYQAASPEERAAMVESQGIESVAPESYALGGLGTVRTGGALARSAVNNLAGRSGAKTIVSGLRNPSGRVGTRGPAPRVAGSRRPSTEGRIGTSGNAPRSGQGGREPTPSVGSGRSSVSDKAREVSMGGKPRSTASKPRARVNPDGTLRPAGTPPPGAAAATPGAAAATETAKTLAQRAIGLGKTAVKTAGTGALLVGAGAGLRSSTPSADDPALGMDATSPEFLAAKARLEAGGGISTDGDGLGYDPMAESFADRTRREMRERDERAGYSIAGSGNRSRNNVSPQARSLLRRMEDGETLSQADFNAAGYDGRGIRIDGGRQGVGISNTFNARGGYGGLGARDLARLRFREEQQQTAGAGLRRIERADPTISERERTEIAQNAERKSWQERHAIQRQIQRLSLSPGRKAQLIAAMYNPARTSEDIEAKEIGNRTAARAPNAAHQSQISLREEARQADQTTAAFERESQRRLMSEGLRAQGGGGGGGGRSGSGGGSVLGPGGNYSPENVASQAATQMPSIMDYLRRSNLGDFYETPEDAQGAYQNFLDDAARAQSRGALPEWVDDRTNVDMFTLSHALASAESRGIGGRLIGLIPGVRSTRRGTGDMNISSTDTLQSLLNVMRAEDGGEWTEANGSSFKLSELSGPSAQIYQRLKDQFREAGLLNETEE